MLIIFFHSIFKNYLLGKEKQVKNSCYLHYFVIAILTTPKHAVIIVQVDISIQQYSLLG